MKARVKGPGIDTRNYSGVVPLPVRAISSYSVMGVLHVAEPWLLAITAWEMWLRAANRPETTLYLRTYQLRRLAADHAGRGPYDLGLDDLVLWLAAHDWKPETRRAYRASLRSFYGWAQLAGHVVTSPAGLLPRIDVPRARPRPAPEAVLLQAMSESSERVRVMLMLAAFAGLRRSEIARGHTRDLTRDDEGWSLRVRGKGGHVRDVPLTPALAGALTALPPGFFFPGDDHGHLSPAYVGKLVSASLPQYWTAHTLRHRFATRLRSRQVQLDVIQELLGHASVDTTRIYTQVPHADARAAVMAAA